MKNSYNVFNHTLPTAPQPLPDPRSQLSVLSLSLFLSLIKRLIYADLVLLSVVPSLAHGWPDWGHILKKKVSSPPQKAQTFSSSSVSERSWWIPFLSMLECSLSSCSGNHSGCQFTSAVALSCPEDIFVPVLPGLHLLRLSTPLPQWGSDTDVLFVATLSGHLLSVLCEFLH